MGILLEGRNSFFGRFLENEKVCKVDWIFWKGGNNFWHVGEMGIFFGRLARFFKKFSGRFESIVDKFARWAYFQTLSC